MKKVIALCNKLAPPNLAVEGDNIGLLVGSPETKLGGIVVALDVTDAAIDLAVKKGCNLIIAHHPLIFTPIKKINPAESQGRLIDRLIKNDIAVFVMHTNLDSAPRGLNHEVAGLLGLKDIRPVKGGGISYRIGKLAKPLAPEPFAKEVKKRLGLKNVRLYDGKAGFGKIKKVAVCTGSGGDLLSDAASHGADALVTGDVRHHHAMECRAIGKTIIDAGHLGTERPMIKLVADYLKKSLAKSSKKTRIDCLHINETFKSI